MFYLTRFTLHLCVGNNDQEILVFSSQNVLLLKRLSDLHSGDSEESCATDFGTLVDGKVYRCESIMKLVELGSF